MKKKGTYLGGVQGMRFITLTSPNNIPNSTQIDYTQIEIIVEEVFAFLHFCDLESRSRSIRAVSKCRSIVSVIRPCLNQIH